MDASALAQAIEQSFTHLKHPVKVADKIIIARPPKAADTVFPCIPTGEASTASGATPEISAVRIRGVIPYVFDDRSHQLDTD